jgi:hypothetical protein
MPDGLKLYLSLGLFYNNCSNFGNINKLKFEEKNTFSQFFYRTTRKKKMAAHHQPNKKI